MAGDSLGTAVLRWIAVGGAFAALVPAPAHASGVETFYKGRSISLFIGFSAGSGYDIYARLLARYIGRHIPGNPSVIPQNMPGGGSLKVANYMHSVAAKDGSAIATISRSLPIEPLLGDVQFDGRKFTWIGNIANNASLCATWHTTGITTWQDVLTKPFALATQGAGTDPHIFGLILKKGFGAKVKIVSGYPGGSEMNLAMERGEVDGRCGWSWDSIKSTRPDWLKDKKINLLTVFALERGPEVPAEVPLAIDLAKTDEQREILRMHLAGQGLGRPFLAPPGIPDDRKAALRAAFDATMKDADFVADITKASLEVSPMSGAEIDRLLADIYATPKEVIEKAKLAIRN